MPARDLELAAREPVYTAGLFLFYFQSTLSIWTSRPDSESRTRRVPGGAVFFSARIQIWLASYQTGEDRVCNRRCAVDASSTNELPELPVATRHLLADFEDDQRR